jgi:dynactin 5
VGSNCIIQRNAIIRGDLRRAGSRNAIALAFGSYCFIGENSIIKPPFKQINGVFSYFPARIGKIRLKRQSCLYRR